MSENIIITNGDYSFEVPKIYISIEQNGNIQLKLTNKLMAKLYSCFALDLTYEDILIMETTEEILFDYFKSIAKDDLEQFINDKLDKKHYYEMAKYLINCDSIDIWTNYNLNKYGKVFNCQKILDELQPENIIQLLEQKIITLDNYWEITCDILKLQVILILNEENLRNILKLKHKNTTYIRRNNIADLMFIHSPRMVIIEQKIISEGIIKSKIDKYQKYSK